MERLLKQIGELRLRTCSDPNEKEYKLLQLHRKLSKLFFDAVRNDDRNTIKSILSSPSISQKYLIDDNGYDAVEYSLFSSNNELFFFLYNLNDFTGYYFKNIPNLFVIALKRKNFELIKFFLTNFKKSLRKENVVECLFYAVQNKQKDIIKIILNNFLNFLDSRNIQPTILYSISYDKVDDLKLILSYQELLDKFQDQDIEKMFLLSILNHNEKSMEMMLSNKYFIKALSRLDKYLIKNIEKFADSKNNVSIMKHLTRGLL